jgi:capsular polysaccharide biosynthesis protein
MRISFGALRAVRRRAGIPLLGLCAGLAGAQAVTGLTPRTYEASASLVVTTGAADGAGGREADLTLAQNLAPTIARLVESRDVSLDTAAALQLPQELVVGHLSGAFEPGLQIITVKATARTGVRAAAIANAATGSMSRQLARLKIVGGTEITAQPLDQASAPVEPSLPKPPLNNIFGGLAGLLAGLGLVTLRDQLDHRLRRLSKIEAQLGLPVLGVFPRLPRRIALRHAHTLHSRVEVADAVRTTVACLTVLTSSLPRRRLLVTSAHNDDSKALVATLLALGLAGHQNRATLIEGQPQRPLLSGHRPEIADRTVQSILDDGPEPTDRSAALTVLTVDSLDEPLGATTDLSERLGTLLDTLADRGADVVIHGPPVLAGAELAALAKHADGVLLVVQRGVTDTAEAIRAALLIQRLGVPLVGVLVVDGVGEVTPEAAIWPTKPSRTGSGGAKHRRPDPPATEWPQLAPVAAVATSPAPSWSSGQRAAAARATSAASHAAVHR